MRIGLAALTALAALASCAGDDSFDVQWTEVGISDDRRSIEVTSYYGPFCARDPDGVGIDIGDDEIVVWAQLHDEDGDDECNADCSLVTQRLDLDEPLPDRPIVQRSAAHLGCGA